MCQLADPCMLKATWLKGSYARYHLSVIFCETRSGNIKLTRGLPFNIQSLNLFHQSLYSMATHVRSCGKCMRHSVA